MRTVVGAEHFVDESVAAFWLALSTGGGGQQEARKERNIP